MLHAVHGPEVRTRDDPSLLVSGGPDIPWAPKVEHAVQCADGDGHFGCSTPILTRTCAPADHALKTAYVGLDQNAPVAARHFLPSHAALFLGGMQMPVALRRGGLGGAVRHRAGAWRRNHGSIGVACCDLVMDAVLVIGTVGGE